MAIQIQDTSTNGLHQIGQYVIEYAPRRNAFVDTLMNRIVMTVISSRSWDNPYQMFFRGTMALGETIEEAFVNIARPFDFNPDVAEKTLFRREFPDVRTTFHTLNYQKFYKQTISEQQLRTAFVQWQGITDLISRVVEAMYTSMYYDLFVTTKYMLCRAVLNGGIGGYKVTDFTSNSNLGDLVSAIKGVSNDMTFLGTKYNEAGVYNATDKSDQYVFIDTMLDAKLDVNVLAQAFNMDKVEFAGRRILMNGWDNHDTARLAELFGNDPDYEAFTENELAVLAGIGAIIVDRDVFMMWDNLLEMDQTRNWEGLYWNYVLHAWKTFSLSPFANAVAFTKDVFSITSVTITNADGTAMEEDDDDNPTATVDKGRSIQLAAEVVGTGIYNGAVTWSLTGAEESGTYIMGGTLRVATNETAESLVVTATSIADPEVSGTATITIGS